MTTWSPSLIPCSTSTRSRSCLPSRFFFLITRRPPTSTRQATLFPYTTLFRSRLLGDPGARMAGESAHVHLVHDGPRSEEHTSELQSLTDISYAVFCLKKKK